MATNRYKIELIVQSESESWEEVQLMAEQALNRHEWLTVESIGADKLES